ncbi:hypothetical protein UCRPA7_3842 [Phaeoacremonium minimum UCRPA7]|uniref:DUF7582 domain-containing protein n=1 Tax=Phaeoacremonium minimum (strain UCR-PA7) TaxID=1286976 RepID=R8BMS4_PHAM7|nr:hypothetical protein UCRPA7_3842 [Phaeoacremonium minimum UCRPA7]EOO00644.1 hypothetical protein UCRPA7_3842 [Phaeoacremonium minimum UCRPA7]
MEKVLSQVMERAQKKFRIGLDWLPAPVSATTYGLSPYLIHRSIVQNEVLFSSEGLTLLSLDHLYTFKSALASYTSTSSAFRLEDAVDELRRYVLSNGRRKLQKSLLLRSYEWLRVNDAALSDVSRMYRRAYGGPEKDSGLENDVDIVVKPKPMSPKPLPEEPLGSDKEGDVTDFEEDDEDDTEDVITPVKAVPTPKPTPTPSVIPPKSTSPYKTPSPGLKGPALRLQTTFDKPAKKVSPPPQPKVTIGDAINIELHDIARDDEEDDADAELTARPSSNTRGPAFPLFNSFSIDEVMFSPVSALTPHKMGPMTPNDYDDISPTTRGEWGFLMVGDSWKAKTAAVETC